MSTSNQPMRFYRPDPDDEIQYDFVDVLPRPADFFCVFYGDLGARQPYPDQYVECVLDDLTYEEIEFELSNWRCMCCGELR